MTYADWYEPKPVKPETDALADAMGQALKIERLEAELAQAHRWLTSQTTGTEVTGLVSRLMARANSIETELAEAREDAHKQDEVHRQVIRKLSHTMGDKRVELARYREAWERIAGNPGPIVYEGQLVKDYDTDWFRPIVDAAMRFTLPFADETDVAYD